MCNANVVCSFKRVPLSMYYLKGERPSRVYFGRHSWLIIVLHFFPFCRLKTCPSVSMAALQSSQERAEDWAERTPSNWVEEAARSSVSRGCLPVLSESCSERPRWGRARIRRNERHGRPGWLGRNDQRSKITLRWSMRFDRPEARPWPIMTVSRTEKAL